MNIKTFSLQKIAGFLFIILYLSNGLFAQPLHSYIDPFIGSVGMGNVFVGPAAPFGMVKPGPDLGLGRNSGYDPDSLKTIFGFSQTHVSGTGGGPKYGNISVMPFSGKFNSIYQASLRSNEKTQCGYYSVNLKKWNINVELTASDRVAFHRYIFLNDSAKGIKIDAGSFLGEVAIPDSREAQQFVGSEIQILSDTEIQGYGRIRGGWNNGKAYTVYFYAVFDCPFINSGTWKGDSISPDKKDQPDTGEKVGAYMHFEGSKNEIVQLKVGISFLSSQKAKYNVENEIPHWDFNKERIETCNKWEELLKKIEIDGTSDQKIMFYTALYHTMLMPVDRTGENPLWTASLPYYDDFYAIWDTFRSSHPLITLIDPARQADIVNAMLNIYKYDGYLPEARSGNCNGRTQGGSNAEVMIADAFVKGLIGIDYGLALKAMLKDAMYPPGGNGEKEGRGGLTDYNSLGYVSSRFVRAGTRTVEYAYDDYCLAQVAKGKDRWGEYQRFIKQSGNWKNLWRDVDDHGARGFIMPKDPSGKWIDSIQCDMNEGVYNYVPYTPLTFEWPICVCWWCGFFYEGSSWEYSFYVPHDVPMLIEKSGGKEAFRKRLDTFFDNGYYNVGNEPSFLTSMLYHWIGRPDLSSQRTRAIIDKNYNSSRSGIPGNDDSGAMSSWFAFHMMGLYPNAGQPYYLLTAPYFKETKIKLEQGKEFKIVAEKLSDKNVYIKSAKLNNKPFNQAWIDHSDIINGGELVFEMTDKPSDWGSKIQPPTIK
ncbi:MAG: GH92 family glycosyl hydrolase [Bacteroidetes bacterium]|nr:GH92 family glycosyl hydrolase [Bacteroidota bacterium]MBU1116953.1 GH92 family glycosyl hydrolase [Bacteroidota bacterium]MBU1799126.1 GH92 family glycosyl hydrolase [Bacteroidota bacterium]